MKRTTLLLNEDLIAEASRVSGQSSRSKTVELALMELVRRARANKLLDLAGSGLWQGELSEMRRDRTLPRPRAVRVSR
jgi:Arc/MetJ family transcription regulator